MTMRRITMAEIPEVVAAHYAKKGMPSPYIGRTLPRGERLAALAKRLQEQTERLERLARLIRDLGH